MIVIQDYSRTKIYITDLWREWMVPKFRLEMVVAEPYLTLNWIVGEVGTGRQTLTIDYNDVGGYGYANPSSATNLQSIIQDYIDSAWTDISGGGGGDILTAKGDLLSHNGTSDEILAAGANESYLHRNNATATGIEWVAGTTIVNATTIGAAVSGAASATPNDTDLVMSVDTGVAKKNTWTQIKAFLKTYFDTIYTTTAAVASQITTALTGYLTAATAASTYQARLNNKSTSNQDTSVTTNTMTDIAGLSLPIGASETIYFRAVVKNGNSSTNGSRYTVVIPAGATMFVYFSGSVVNAGEAAQQWIDTSGTESTTVNLLAVATQKLTFEGWVTTSGTSGTIKIRGKSISAANTVTWYAGSWINGNN